MDGFSRKYFRIASFVLLLIAILLVPVCSVQALTKRPTPYGAPIKLIIPSISVNAEVERTSIDQAGILLAPKDPKNVGWYHNGAIPGKRGNAVIGGHVDWTTGPAVFRSLRSMRPGAIIRITNDYGSKLHFQVTSIQVYRNGTVPIQKIAGNSRGIHLNLYTCTGSYNKYSKNYSHRIVVYSTLIP